MKNTENENEQKPPPKLIHGKKIAEPAVQLRLAHLIRKGLEDKEVTERNLCVFSDTAYTQPIKTPYCADVLGLALVGAFGTEDTNKYLKSAPCHIDKAAELLLISRELAWKLAGLYSQRETERVILFNVG